MEELTVDQAHVLLDAVNQLRKAIQDGYKPWADYAVDSAEDLKLTPTGYLQTLASAQVALQTTIVDHDRPAAEAFDADADDHEPTGEPR